MKKEFWKSKTFWGALVLVIAAAYGSYSGQLSYTQFLERLGIALGIFGIRHAIN